MFNMNEEKNSISFTISSEMRMVDHVVFECMEFFKKFDVSHFSSLKLVMRELLINAIEHGNKNIADEKINCVIDKLDGFRFKITVQDNGKGFDYKCLDMRLPENPEHIRNRGYALINAFSDNVEFNEKGNEVAVIINLIPETEFCTTDNGEWKIISPTGDITASSADRFRIILLEMLKQNITKYRFNLKEVNDIDSVSLSVLICFANMLNKQSNDGKLEIVNANQDLINLFLMTRLNKTFNIVEQTASN